MKAQMGIGQSLHTAWDALRTWGARQWLVAAGAGIGFGALVGFATVLIPNSWFARDIAPVWWNYPVLVLTSVLAGMLFATYVRTGGSRVPAGSPSLPPEKEEQRSARFGIVGSVLAWFAVGCPVCNKIALLALGYSGAITWFAPLQPILAVVAVGLTGVALVWRLRGQFYCPTSAGEGADNRTIQVVEAGVVFKRGS